MTRLFILKLADILIQVFVVLMIIVYANDIHIEFVDAGFRFFEYSQADAFRLYILLGGVHVASTLLNRAFLPKEIKSGLRIPYDVIVFSGFIPAGILYLFHFEDTATAFATVPCTLSPLLALVYISLSITETKKITKIVYKTEMEAA